MKKPYFMIVHLLFAWGCLNLIGCNESSDPTPVRLEIPSVTVMDVSNYGDGRDLEVAFPQVTSDDLEEYRIIVTKESNATAFDVEIALRVVNANYTVIAPDQYQESLTLPEEAKDSEGDPIQNEVDYRVFVLAVAKEGTNSISGLGFSGSIVLEEVLIRLGITSLEVADVGNFGDGRDLQVAFDEIANEDLEEYRIVVAKESVASSLDLHTVQALDAERYTRVLPNEYSDELTLAQGAVDSDGETITEGQSYVVIVGTIVADGNINYEGGILASSALILSQTNLVRSVESGFSASGGIVLGPDGSIYIADFGTGAQNGTKILKFDSDGTLIGDFADGLLGPTGGAFDSNGNLYWSSYSASKVHKIDANGNVTDFVNIPGPVAIVVNDADELFIASCDGNDIKKVTTSGTITTFAASSSFNCVNGMTMDNDDNLFACNFEDGNIFKITPDGTVTAFASIPTRSSVNMAYHEGYLYVTGRDDHSIYTVNATSGEVKTLAGTGVRGNTDGAALEAQFSFPNGIKVSADGSKVYVNDVAPDAGTNANGHNFNPNILRVIEIVE